MAWRVGVPVLLALSSFISYSSALDLPPFGEESYNVKLRTTKSADTGSIIQLVRSNRFDPSPVTQLSWRPRAFLYNGFLSDEECEHLVALARDRLQKSMVADNDSGKSIMSEIRTSSGMFLSKGQDEVVQRIEDRIAAWTLLPKENGEAIQILRYQNGEKYAPHFDYFHDKANQELGGHRVATVLMYLSNVTKGGETVFPNSQDKEAQIKDDSWSDCARDGYAVKPTKGDALLFFSLHPDATTDADSLHGSCPVIEGEKWSATKWIHVRSFDLSLKKSHPSKEHCTDESEHCPQWAAMGECEKNPSYMIGSPDYFGSCRRSCKVCLKTSCLLINYSVQTFSYLMFFRSILYLYYYFK